MLFFSFLFLFLISHEDKERQTIVIQSGKGKEEKGKREREAGCRQADDLITPHQSLRQISLGHIVYCKSIICYCL